MIRSLCVLLGVAICGVPLRVETPVVMITPTFETQSVIYDADDPAIWINPENPEKSLLVATDKGDSKLTKLNGALYVFDMQGKILSKTTVDRPNNVDVQTDFVLDGRTIPIAVTAERRSGKLRIFAIKTNGKLRDITGRATRTFAGQVGTLGQPMGIGLYRRPKDGAVYAVLTRVKAPNQGALWQYRLESDGKGRVNAVKVREFGTLVGGLDLEAVAIDDALGFVYYAEENKGIHKWHADPDHTDAGKELAMFGTEGFAGDREGIGIYTHADGTGYLVCTDQIDGGSHYKVYRREGEAGSPHDHTQPLKILMGGADATDGIEVVSEAAGTRFPHGVLIAMNSKGKNFKVYDWREVGLK